MFVPSVGLLCDVHLSLPMSQPIGMDDNIQKVAATRKCSSIKSKNC